LSEKFDDQMVNSGSAYVCVGIGVFALPKPQTCGGTP